MIKNSQDGLNREGLPMKSADIPAFGNLCGVRVLAIGNTVAAPFGAELMAENGAVVTYIESPSHPDIGRISLCPYGFLAEHRNERCISLNLKSETGRAVFLKLLEETDILFEGLKGGTFHTLHLDDETLWSRNKQLVIVHVSGYGETGIPEYVNRPSYDPIGQAAGGYMAITGFPDPEPPTRVPFMCDYYTALFACWSALAALWGTQRNGTGESIDVSQVEVMWKLQYGYPIEYYHSGVVHPRQGNEERDYICFGTYLCADSEYVFICCIARGPVQGLLAVLGLEEDTSYPKNLQLFRRGDVAAEKAEAALRQFCLDHPAKEVDRILNAHNVPCSRIYDLSNIEENPQVTERELFVEWEDGRFGKLKGLNVIPKMKNRPGEFWGAAHDHGADNRDVLSEAGYSADEIEAMYADGTVSELSFGGYYGSKKIQIKSN